MMIPVAAVIFFLAGLLFMAARTGSIAQASPASASESPELADKVIVVNVTGTINIIDTANDIIYGPFLSGTLGSPGGMALDVAVTPDGNTALISNFGDSAVFFVDITDPFSPSVVMSMTMPMFAEDIAISPDGNFALVTDGGFNTYVASIDMISRTLVYTADLQTRYSNAVAIAPNRTVVLADYFKGEVHSMLLDATGVLSYTGSYSYTVRPDGSVSETVTSLTPISSNLAESDRNTIESPAEALAYYASRPSPVNVAVAPDGETVLICNVSPYTSTMDYAKYQVGVYHITAPGELTFSGVITGLNRATQSVAFSADGNLAYLAGNGGNTMDLTYDQLSVVEILGPGNVHLVKTGAADYPRITGSQLFGVDTIVAANGKAYLGFPTISGGNNILRIVDLDDYGVRSLQTFGIPAGVAAIPVKRFFFPFLDVVIPPIP
jgi:DNA-binding beta-propeller fold protein YncE